jgi:hypothetical protein
MRITAIVGTRPQLIKLAALRPHLSPPIEPFVIDTAQHHDELLAGQIYREMRTGTDAVLAVINRVSRMYCGPCTSVVGHNPQGEDIECGVDLYADRESLEDIQCPRCQIRVNPREQLLTTIKRRDLLPEPALLETLATLGEKVSRVKLYDWIKSGDLRPRGYVHQGRVVPERIQRGDSRVFSLSQARQLRSLEGFE